MGGNIEKHKEGVYFTPPAGQSDDNHRSFPKNAVKPFRLIFTNVSDESSHAPTASIHHLGLWNCLPASSITLYSSDTYLALLLERVPIHCMH